MRCVGLLVAVAFAGCAPDPCGGPPPAIETCEVGVAWADCGGAGAPTFACVSEDHCHWFATSCVAEHFAPTGCAPTRFNNFGLAWGDEAWDRARETNLTVVRGPLAPGATRPSIVCDGPATELCGLQANQLVVREGAGTEGSAWTVVGVMHSIGGTDLSVELMTSATGSLVSRVCFVPYTDWFDYSCPTMPPSSQPRRGVCAISGTVTLDEAMPDATVPSMDVSASFGGGTVEIHL